MHNIKHEPVRYIFGEHKGKVFRIYTRLDESLEGEQLYIKHEFKEKGMSIEEFKKRVLKIK